MPYESRPSPSEYFNPASRRYSSYHSHPSSSSEMISPPPNPSHIHFHYPQPQPHHTHPQYLPPPPTHHHHGQSYPGAQHPHSPLYQPQRPYDTAPPLSVSPSTSTFWKPHSSHPGHQVPPIHPVHPPQWTIPFRQHESSPLPPLRPLLDSSPAEPPTRQFPFVLTPMQIIEEQQPHTGEVLDTGPDCLKKNGLSGRNPTSCDTCSKRKERCDRSRPCARCVERHVGHLCSYTRVDRGVYTRKRRKIIKTDEGEPQTRATNSSSGDNSYGSQETRTEDREEEEDITPVQCDLRPTRGRSILSSRRPVHCYQTISPHRLMGVHPVSDERSTGYPPIQQQLNEESSATSANRSPPIRKTMRSGGWSQAESTATSGQSNHDDDGDELMEEDECAGIGSRRRNMQGEDGPDEERVFFGTSHFGPQLAVKVIKGTMSVPLSDVRLLPRRGASLVEDSKPYTLVTQLRELLRLLPPKERCDKYIRAFFEHYNDHTDIIYEPDFMRKYSNFWHNSADLTRMGSLDLRELALILILLAFGVLLEQVATPQISLVEEMVGTGTEQGDKVESLLYHARSQGLSQMEREELSLTWSWGAKRALSEASRFNGESLDTVRAGTMLAFYFVICRRVAEGWTAIGEAIRAAHAQGMHVDGASWSNMPAGEAELRRRLWAQMYALDRSISLFLGRPSAIQSEYTTAEPSNITDDELGWILPISAARPLSSPTKSTFLILHLRLAQLIDHCLKSCFGLRARTYEDVLQCEAHFEEFKESLPPHFRLDASQTDCSLDNLPGNSWLVSQRLSLKSKFHLARISLHRPYLLRSFGKGGERFLISREACISSSIEEIGLRTRLTCSDPLDRFKWMTVASGFNPATIVGILCCTNLNDSPYDHTALLRLLEDYIACEERTVRRDETLEAELAVLRMMVDISKGKQEGDIRAPTSTPKQRGENHRSSDPTRGSRNGQYNDSNGNARILPTLAPAMSFERGSSNGKANSSTANTVVLETNLDNGTATAAESRHVSTNEAPQSNVLSQQPQQQAQPQSQSQSQGSWLSTPPWELTADQFPPDADAWLRWFQNDSEREFGSFSIEGLIGSGLWNESPVEIKESEGR